MTGNGIGKHATDFVSRQARDLLPFILRKSPSKSRIFENEVQLTAHACCVMLELHLPRTRSLRADRIKNSTRGWAPSPALDNCNRSCTFFLERNEIGQLRGCYYVLVIFWRLR